MASGVLFIADDERCERWMDGWLDGRMDDVSSASLQRPGLARRRPDHEHTDYTCILYLTESIIMLHTRTYSPQQMTRFAHVM
ncbi:unnamed protein product [Danaus chrysippus]|uniref:(African queen) hypothetical protein n=1 Tax=Danaus chrysippus TaxID=151541 RepID=A0A8J2VR15_9NEOP|nr:unnamed protein product [Danaus chrysippus]